MAERREPERRRPQRGSGWIVPGGPMSDEEMEELARGVLRRVKDPEALAEIEQLMRGERKEFSPRVLQLLQNVAAEVRMMMRHRPR